MDEEEEALGEGAVVMERAPEAVGGVCWAAKAVVVEVGEVVGVKAVVVGALG